ncbi:MAG: flagellar basal body-associated FliL family protein [Firmicutes bacterium]|nr:flagellar basal body-associated FliL family protein [Bacillota bacterium]
MADDKTVERKLQLDVKLIIFGIALLILASVATSFTTYLFFSSANPPEPEKIEEEEPPIPEFGPTHDIGIFTVNLAGGGGNRFARLGISLELADESIIPLVEERMPQIRDAVISIMTLKSIDQIDDQEGRRQLRAEIAHRLETILGKGNVKNIFFTEFVFQ